MKELRFIRYGVSGDAPMHKANACFMDRAAKMHDLENVRHAVSLRLRRFGKSLLSCSMKDCCDRRYAERFRECLGGTAIGANPADERGKCPSFAFRLPMSEEV